MSAIDEIERPAAIWWALVVGGMTLLGVDAFSADWYRWWVAHVHPLPSQTVLALIFAAAVPVHVFEAVYAWRLANRAGMTKTAAAWTLQTLVLGWPSTRLLRRRALAILG